MKRKIFVKTDLSTPKVSLAPAAEAVRQDRPIELLPPRNKDVTLPPNPTGIRRFSFSPWYGVGVDELTYALQRQIERFIAKQDAELESSTVITYCRQGTASFLDYVVLRSAALKRDLRLADIDRDLIDGYLRFLDDGGTATTTQAGIFSTTKSVLKALCRRGLIDEVHTGDHRTFPVNPFPGNHRKHKGEKPLPKAQRDAFALAVKQSALPIFDTDAKLTSSLLVYALLVVALHTGRNTTPLVEITPDSLVPHPKDGTMFLVLYKRRGHTTHRVAIRAERTRDDLGIEALPTIRTNVAKLLRRVIDLSAELRTRAPEHLRNRVWLYESNASNGRSVDPQDAIRTLSDSAINYATGKLVKKHSLVDNDGKPLRINVSRLRKTFVNRVFDILDGDVAGTAIAAGNTKHVVDVSYLRPGEDSTINWKFMGQSLVSELLTNTLGASERTPLGRCSDVMNGEYAPKRDGAACMSFLNCLRCRNYVVTGDDLYKLFSFYWRVLRERSRIDKRRWAKQFSHIVRLIERDVVAVGLQKGIFKQTAVDDARERARTDPHPFWKSDTIIEEVGDLP